MFYSIFIGIGDATNFMGLCVNLKTFVLSWKTKDLSLENNDAYLYFYIFW